MSCRQDSCPEAASQFLFVKKKKKKKKKKRKKTSCITFSLEGARRSKVKKKVTLMASMAYSTWKRRPSGENVLTPRSYSERVKNMVVVYVYVVVVETVVVVAVAAAAVVVGASGGFVESNEKKLVGCRLVLEMEF
jgi:hypothetical protein